MRGLALGLALLSLTACLVECKSIPNPMHSLTQVGPVCVEQFHNTTNELYEPGDACKKTIQLGFSATAKDVCPPEEDLKDCLGASNDTAVAWTQYVSQCGVLNIVQRTPNGPEDKTKTAYCMPQYKTPQDFYDAIAPAAGVSPPSGTSPPPSPKSNARAVRVGAVLVAVLAGASLLLA